MRITVPGLKPDKIYSLQFQAVGTDSKVGNWSRRFQITTIGVTSQPEIPANVTIAAVGNAFHMEWDIVNEDENGFPVKIDRYEIELEGDPGNAMNTASVPQIETGARVAYDLTFEENIAKFLVAKPTVSIRVRSIDARGIASEWSTIVTAGNAAPAAPTGLTATQNVESIDLKWNENNEVDLIGYRVYLSVTGIGGTYNRIYQGNALNYSFPSSMYGTDHFFVARAYDEFNQESADSSIPAAVRPLNAFIVDVTPPPLPTSVAMTVANSSDGGPGSGNVTWTYSSPPSDLIGFNVRWRKTGATNWQLTTVDKDARAAEVLLESPYVNYEAQVRAFDSSANYSAWTGSATGTAAANGAPSTPAAPTTAASTLQIQVTPTGNKAAGGAMEADVEFYEVYTSITTGFTPSTANMIGTIPVGPAMVSVFPIPASGGTSTQTWFVKVIAVDSGGLKSSASAQSTANPNLIDTANIVDLAVTSAKITSLVADKLTAGSGIIANLTVKSTLTIGDASTTGFIQSENWNGTSTGWQLTKSGLTIFNGTIAATAITLTSSWANSVGATMTTIDGGIIKTGSIISQTNVVISGSPIPLWSIPLNGYATFAGLTVRGGTTLGVSGDSTASYIKSWNYSGVGGAGWYMDAAGNLVANSGTFGGSLNAATGTFSGALSAASGTFTGTLSGANGTFTGSLSGASGTFTGALSGATGTFSGTITASSFNTATSGQRLNISTTVGLKSRIDFYSGSANETTPGRISHENVDDGSYWASELNLKDSSINGLTAANIKIGSFYSKFTALGSSYVDVNGGSITLTATGGVGAGGTPVITMNADNVYIGNSSGNYVEIRDNLICDKSVDISTGGLTVTAGGIIVNSGGLDIDGNIFFTTLATGGGSLAVGTRYVYADGTTGRLTASTTALSTRAMKFGIKNLGVDPKTILKMQPVEYRLKDIPDELRMGFIAEDVDALGLEHVVGYNEKTGQVQGLDYMGLTAGLLAVDQYQEKRINKLEKLVEELQARLDK